MNHDHITLRSALFSSFGLAITLTLLSCGTATEKESAPQSSSTTAAQTSSQAAVIFVSQTLAADHPSLRYQGRIDHRQANRPALIWQGSQVVVSYWGILESVTFADLSGSAYFDLIVDGKRQGAITARNGSIDLRSYQSGLDPAVTHTLNLTKRSEASAGHVRLTQFTLNGQPDADSQTAGTTGPDLLFFGDSITAGACSEDGAQDQWDNRSTHNALVSYAAVAAGQLDSRYQNIAISGVGISAGYQSYTALDVWDRYYPDPGSAKPSFDAFRPDIIFLNYGENDDSFTSGQNQPFPATYTDRYLQLLNLVRQQYPQSAIVILRGGMWGGANSTRLRGPLDEVVRRFTAQDGNAYHFAFNHWSSLHPRTADHKTMAGELVTWLRQSGLVQ